MGKRAVNLVLYAGKDRPLASLDVSDPFLAAKVSAKASQYFAHCSASGAHPADLKLVRETREADEEKKLTFTEFAECDPTTGKVVGKLVKELDDIFAAPAAKGE